MSCKAMVTSSLTKVFPNQAPQALYSPLSLLLADSLSFQIAYYLDQRTREKVTLSIHSPLIENISLYQVELSPSNYPCHTHHDDRYLSTTPGLFPDRLEALPIPGEDFMAAKQWRSFWVKVTTTPNTPGGLYPITLKGVNEEGVTLFEITQTIEVIGALLPPNPIYHTQWFHADCLADYYKVKPLSDEHFDIIENFVALAVKRDINTLLTPVFTPPLDTQVGGERTTVQLVKVFADEERYTFDFTLFEKWVAMCKRQGVQYFEISHLFSQWGAAYAPKVMAMVKGEEKQIFGWNDSATGEKYTRFLQAFLPALTNKLEELNINKRCLFHISDEPSKEHLHQYKAAREIVEPYLKDYLIIDALSDIDLYRQGAVPHPIPSNDHIEAFLADEVPDLWTYYCTGQWENVSNRFFSLPSSANRILGLQLYKYNIKGFLHWGYNFYNSQYSVAQINPYAITDAGGAFPSGDPFLVYPGPQGVPEESIRLVVLEEAFHDLRCLTLLENQIGRDKALALIEEGLPTPLTFDRYPIQEDYLLAVREKINQAIKISL